MGDQEQFTGFVNRDRFRTTPRRSIVVKRQPIYIDNRRRILEGVISPAPKIFNEKEGRNTVFNEKSKLDPPLQKISPETTPEANNSGRLTDLPLALYPEKAAKPIHSESQATKKSYSKPQLALMFAGIIVFMVGMVASILSFRANSVVEAQTKKVQNSTQSENTGDHPDETQPDQKSIGAYKVAPNLPRMLSIPKIGVEARVRPLGTNNNSELKAPANIYDAGWYEGSSKPGQPGAMLIDGHVHGLKKPGIFYNLKKISVGDVLKIERGDGNVFSYKIMETKVYNRSNVDMAATLRPINPGSQGLNLITCTGPFNRAANTYEERLVVFASLVN